MIEIKKDFEFDGYQGNEAQTSAKVIRNVFRMGDAYFNSGDLLTVDKDYFVYFADRIGDTFRYHSLLCTSLSRHILAEFILFIVLTCRWKGENVSTIEVSNVVSDLSWIEDGNVYGVEVPGTVKFLN